MTDLRIGLPLVANLVTTQSFCWTGTGSGSSSNLDFIFVSNLDLSSEFESKAMLFIEFSFNSYSSAIDISSCLFGCAFGCWGARGVDQPDKKVAAFFFNSFVKYKFGRKEDFSVFWACAYNDVEDGTGVVAEKGVGVSRGCTCVADEVCVGGGTEEGAKISGQSIPYPCTYLWQMPSILWQNQRL